MPDPHDEIADLEVRIIDLSEAAERCARTMLAAKVAVAAAVFLLIVMLAGLIRFSPLVFVLAVAGALGGVALFGSTRSTRDQIVATLKAHEAQRAEMIDRLALQEVGD
jgi:O-antigen ligase